MGFANEILDAIEIMVKQVVEDNTTKIYTGVCKTVSTSTCNLLINGKENTVKYYGGTPMIGTVYQVFIPFGNMSAAFIIVPGGGSQDPETGVSSVNGKTGAVVLTASDVGALPNTTIIPTKTSQLDNDSGFIGSSALDGYAKTTDIPTKTSQLTNNSGFITAIDVPVKSVDGSIGAVVTNAVKTTSQSLTDAQKAQARTNIGAGTSSFDGNYKSLSNKPTIPTQTSQLENNSGFITTADVPTKVSQLDNDTGFITSNDVPEYSVVKATDTTDYAAVYYLTKNGVNTGVAINIPKDLFVESGEIVTNPSGQPAGKYLKLVLQNQTEPIYINVADLVDAYTSGIGISISVNNEISIKIVVGNGLSADTDGIKMATVTTVANGAMLSSDKVKLDSIENGAQKNTVTGVKGDNEATYQVGNVNITKANIGLSNVDNVKQYSSSNPPPYPVSNVNNKTGAVVLNASDVGAVATSDITQTLGSSATKVPSEKAVSDALSGAGAGDMLKSVYDPNRTVETDGGIPNYVKTNAVAKTGDTMTGTLRVGSVSLQTNGYVTGTWLQSTATNHLTNAATKIAVQDGSGWVYHRTTEEIKSDIGLSNVDNVKQYSASNPPPYPVTSVNAKTGKVALTASDVGGLPVTGGTMSGVLSAQSNTSYTTAQVRNIIISTELPSGGQSGEIWIRYSK